MRRRVAAVLFLSATLAFAARAPPPLSRIQKMARLLALEDRRSAGSGDLERLLRDPERGVRRRAALCAGRVGDPALAPTLIELMNDGEAEVRQMSAFALGLIGDKLALERLVVSLKDVDPVVRGRSAEALGRIGDARAAQPIADMVRAALPRDAPLISVRGDDPSSLGDPWLEPRLGLHALARFKDDTRAAQALLVPGGQPRFDWWAATWTAMRLEQAAFRPLLVAAAGSSEPLSRAFAARGLGALEDADSVDLLARLVRDPEALVAVHALRALGAVGDARGTPAVAALLASPSAALRAEALRAIAALPADRALRSKVVGLVGDRDAAVRAAALQALARTDPGDFALVLSGLDPDPEWSVRSGLAAALAEVGDEVSLGILFSMLADDDARVLPGVLEALRKARGAEAAETLRKQLEHANFAVRAAAADGLAELKAQGDTARLATAWERALADRDLDARLSIVGALQVQKDPAARTALRDVAARDPVRVVRARAAASLQAPGETAPDPGPEAASRAALDYREAMALYDPVPGQQLYTPRAILHTRRGRIEIHLNVVEAPLTVASFLDLARRGFYDGLTFHRVVPGFVIQGGDPRGDGSGGPGYTLRCEIGQRPYGRGAVGMALSGKDTGGSQFFITHTPTPHLDGAYTLFGWVAAGLEVVDAIRPGDVIERVDIWDGR